MANKEIKKKTEKKVKKKEVVKKIEEMPSKQETKKEVAKIKDKKGKIKKQTNLFNDPYKIVMYPVSTEKSIRLMESENKLIFRVSLKAKKTEIKKAIEDLFNVKVMNVTTLITQNGHKRAYVKFSDETPAIDIATQLGMM